MKSVFDRLPVYRLAAQPQGLARAIPLTLWDLKVALDEKRQRAPDLYNRAHIVKAIASQWHEIKGTVHCVLSPHPLETPEAGNLDWPLAEGARLLVHGSRAGIHIEMREAEPLLACLVRHLASDTFHMTLAAPIDGPTPAHLQAPPDWESVAANRLSPQAGSVKPSNSWPAMTAAEAGSLQPTPDSAQSVHRGHSGKPVWTRGVKR